MVRYIDPIMADEAARMVGVAITILIALLLCELFWPKPKRKKPFKD
jgi:hypothetical protein